MLQALLFVHGLETPLYGLHGYHHADNLVLAKPGLVSLKAVSHPIHRSLV